MKKIKNKVMRFKYLSCIAVMVLTGFTACQDSDDVGENYTTFTGETISDFLENNAEYSDFTEALKTANAFCWSRTEHTLVSCRTMRRWKLT